jgi:signal transduction histidine kinase
MAMVAAAGKGNSLSIARRVVIDKHKGNLFFETEKDKGTPFVIGLSVVLVE